MNKGPDIIIQKVYYHSKLDELVIIYNNLIWVVLINKHGKSILPSPCNIVEDMIYIGEI